ncbi:YbaB/EbfC family nucleoid-associated protein [Amycolatopsis keratiniphila]|uniref:YbaB/EbfC family nucleoid-associated protein n=1 Tax=Amycolatopsis keratiniphila TaxID=129921 RepID=UPI00087C4F42|nr:YbaB/EbfC family nucleoid-associated protein [Amycolatopsis keratiniphila]SDU56078.1 YbaB/EbfC DNA-binding family protein [Amycolatopsis keratiniphila]
MAEKPAPKKPGNDRQAMLEALAALSVDASSPDGAVSVSVNTDGVMTRLRVGEAASRMSPAEIADTVMRTYQEAQQGSAKRSAELMAPIGNAGYITDRLRWRLGFTPSFQETGETVTPPSPRRTTAGTENVVLKDRSEEPAGPVPDEQPESEDQYYEQGLRYRPSW